MKWDRVALVGPGTARQTAGTRRSDIPVSCCCLANKALCSASDFRKRGVIRFFLLKRHLGSSSGLKRHDSSENRVRLFIFVACSSLAKLGGGSERSQVGPSYGTGYFRRDFVLASSSS